MGKKFTGSFDRLLKLSPRYVMVTCLTHGDGVEERGGGGGVGSWRQGVGVGEAKRLGEGRVKKVLIHELAHVRCSNEYGAAVVTP